MKTPEEFYFEVLNSPEFKDKDLREVRYEAMKRFGLQCWVASTELSSIDETSDTERGHFNRYLQNLYLNQIAKQAQENGDYK